MRKFYQYKTFFVSTSRVAQTTISKKFRKGWTKQHYALYLLEWLENYRIKKLLLCILLYGTERGNMLQKRLKSSDFQQKTPCIFKIIFNCYFWKIIWTDFWFCDFIITLMVKYYDCIKSYMYVYMYIVHKNRGKEFLHYIKFLELLWLDCDKFDKDALKLHGFLLFALNYISKNESNNI